MGNGRRNLENSICADHIEFSKFLLPFPIVSEVSDCKYCNKHVTLYSLYTYRYSYILKYSIKYCIFILFIMHFLHPYFLLLSLPFDILSTVSYCFSMFCQFTVDNFLVSEYFLLKSNSGER